MLLMSLMKKVARKHGFIVLLHEKPFAGINGSGKHCNWSLSTDTGVLLHAPGKTPESTLRFVTFIVETLMGVYRHNGLLKASIMSATNAHRLGANEAPPAIISSFLGKQLSELLDHIEQSDSEDDFIMAGKQGLKMDIPEIPELMIDNTDRNRTSPFAFTGNRFEFRAVGSEANCASAMIALNSAVAEALTDFKARVDALIAQGEDRMKAIVSVLREDITACKPIRFDGNGYSEEWVEEARRRGLDCETSCPVIFDNYLSESSVRMFTSLGVMTRKELEARNEVKWGDLHEEDSDRGPRHGRPHHEPHHPRGHPLPSMLLKNVQSMRAVFPAEKAEKLSSRNMKIIEDIAERTQAIEQGVEELVNARKVANRIADEREGRRLPRHGGAEDGGHPLPHRQTGALRQRRASGRSRSIASSSSSGNARAQLYFFPSLFPGLAGTPRRAPSRFVSPPGHFSFWHAICTDTVKRILKTHITIMEKKGNIGVTTENIFPVIKQFLYSDHEIFLREMVSNAVDATQKMKTLASAGDFSGDLGDLSVRVTLDEQAGTLTISDRGIGMTAEEIDKYINRIAFSGVTDFLDKYKDKAEAIIGHFGLGFYSAFMVSKKVEIVTKSWREGSHAVRWTCDGSPEYTIDEVEKADRGSDIILHIDDDSKNYLRSPPSSSCSRSTASLWPCPWSSARRRSGRTASRSIPTRTTSSTASSPSAEVAVVAQGRGLQEVLPHPLPHERRPPVPDPPQRRLPLHAHRHPLLPAHQVQHRAPAQQDPALLQPGLRHRPRRGHRPRVPHAAPRRHRLSRHPAQRQPQLPPSDANVKKISTYITKKVADRLSSIFKENRKEYEEKWDDLKLFINYGMLSERDAFYDRAKDFALMKDTEGKYFTFDEYRTLIKDNRTDKDGNLVYLYAVNKEEQYTYIEAAKAKGYSVLLCDGELDVPTVSLLEQKLEKSHFVRVDSDTVDRLIAKDEVHELTLSQDERDNLSEAFRSRDAPSRQDRVWRRGPGPWRDGPADRDHAERVDAPHEGHEPLPAGHGLLWRMPDSYMLVLNADHPLIKQILADETAATAETMKPVLSEIKGQEARLAALRQARRTRSPRKSPRPTRTTFPGRRRPWRTSAARSAGSLPTMPRTTP